MIGIFIDGGRRLVFPACTTVYQALVWYSTSGDLPRKIPEKEDLRIFTSVVVFGEYQDCVRCQVSCKKICSSSLILEGMRLFTTTSKFRHEQRLWLNLAAQRKLVKCPKGFINARCTGSSFFVVSADPRSVLVVGPYFTNKGLTRLKEIW